MITYFKYLICQSLWLHQNASWPADLAPPLASKSKQGPKVNIHRSFIKKHSVFKGPKDMGMGQNLGEHPAEAFQINQTSSQKDRSWPTAKPTKLPWDSSEGADSEPVTNGWSKASGRYIQKAQKCTGTHDCQPFPWREEWDCCWESRTRTGSSRARNRGLPRAVACMEAIWAARKVHDLKHLCFNIKGHPKIKQKR